MLSFEEALVRILALGAPVLPAETTLLDDIDGRILGEDIVATVDLPHFDCSSIDGYAVSTHDFSGALPLRLPVVRIASGAPLPDRIDAVVKPESARRDGDTALFTTKPRAGQGVRRRGEDLRAGTTVITKGTRLRPPHLALCAALDRAAVAVARRPEVAILATGDELRRAGTDALPGTVPESNTIVLRTMARRAGARAKAQPFVRDDRAAAERAFAAALDEADLLVTVGGDHAALAALGVELDVWRVAVKPDKPLAIGRRARPGRRDAIVLGLPSNPSAAMTSFALFGCPLLRAMQGETKPFPLARRARMTRAHAHDPGRLEFARATFANGEVTTLSSQAVTSVAHSDAFVIVPPDANGIPAGAEVDVLFMSDLTA